MIKDILWKDKVFAFHVSSIAICYNLVVIVHELELNALRIRRLQINQNLLIYFKAMQKWTLGWIFSFYFHILSLIFLFYLRDKIGDNECNYHSNFFSFFIRYDRKLIQFDALFVVRKNSDILRMKSILLISNHLK